MLWFMTVLKSFLNRDGGRRTVNGGRWTANGERRTTDEGLKFVFLLFCFCLSGSLYAQPTGYQGKRLMFKTDVISPLTERGINAGLEYVVLRNLVVGTDFSLTGKKYTQRLDNYYDVHGRNPESKAQINDMQVGVTVQYFLNTALPAPNGSYVFSKYSIGTADIFGNKYEIDEGDPDNNTLQAFKVSQVSSRQLDIGLGYQEVVFGFLLIDFDFGVSAASLFTDKKDNDDTVGYTSLISNFANKHGPNIYSLGSWRERPGGLGFSVHLKIGILLF